MNTILLLHTIFSFNSIQVLFVKCVFFFLLPGESKGKHKNQSSIQDLYSGVDRMKDAVRRSAKKGMFLNSASGHQRKHLKLRDVDFAKDARLLCAPGSVLKELNVCVKCPLGTYWNMTSRLCKSCPFGTYQSQEGSTSCLSCPPGTSTRKIHVKNLRDCRRK